MGEPFSDTDPDTIEGVYASFGRMVLGAGPPEGSVTISAVDAADFRRQWDALFTTDAEEEADAPDHPAPAGPTRDQGPEAR